MKQRKRLLWQLYPPYLVLILLSLLVANWYASRSFHAFFLDRTKLELKTHAVLFSDQLPALLMETGTLDQYCKAVGKDTAIRITVILPDGQVIGDSEETPRFMENHAGRPEVMAALAGKIGSDIRLSKTLRQNMLYLALPHTREGIVSSVIRMALPLTDVEQEIASFQRNIGLFAVVVAFLAGGLCLLISRRISRPIEIMTLGAERFATGDLSHRLSAPASLELAGLSRAMNQMASELEHRMAAVVSQSREYEAVLTSMMEGVMAIDLDEKILGINPAAAKILSITSPEAKGRSLLEVVRNHDLHQAIQNALKSGEPSYGEDVLMPQGIDQIVHLQCIPLINATSHRIGTLVVMNDVTRMRRLENVRRDFVANVSHEIKTPLTAIKGFVETLQNGGSENTEERERFLAIIRKHADRLNAIVDDLLALARLENRDERGELDRSAHPVAEIIDTAIQVVKKKADDKQIAITVYCDPQLSADVDAPLMEQAVVNLLDNAIKYSPPESPIRVDAAEKNGEILLHVVDQGPGISKAHLPRLFERFYRVDRARSRTLGGTGLGLAIVKHILQVHGGKVSVESTPGKGSDFYMVFPKERIKSV